MAFTYDPVFAADPNNPSTVASNAAITLFNPADPGKAPITITDVTGSPLPNPITVNKNGFGPAFQHPTLDRVGWHGGGFTGYFTSYEGIKNEAVSARAAAQTAAASAGAAATADLATRIAAGQFKGDKGADGSNVLPTDTAIKQAIENTGSATRGALNATYALKSEIQNVAQPALPTMGALKTALDAGESTALSIFGDSTGDSDGTTASADRLAARFARRLAETYPTHHVLFKPFDGATASFKKWTVLQNHASGRRYANFSGRSMRHVPATQAAGAFSTGNMDLRVLASPNSWASGAERMLLARVKGAGAWGTSFQFRWRIDGTGLLLLNWSTDGAAWGPTRTSTAAVPGVNGTPLWLRVTAEINAATGWTVKYYTSPADDGVVWTQLGTTLSFAGALSGGLFNPPAGSYFEVGAEAWQPSSTPLPGKVYEVQIRDGVDGPMIAPAALERWERYADGATTFGGAPTLYVLNASQSGSTMANHTAAGRVAKETPDYGQVVTIYNDGHNEVDASGSTWIPPLEAWVTSVKGRLPDAATNIVGQNPHLPTWGNEAAYGAEHRKRIMESAAAAGRNGWGFINVYQAYLDDPRPLTDLISGDGLHPTQAGYALSGDTVAAAAGIS